MPEYRPNPSAQDGFLRIFGAGMKGLVSQLEAGYLKRNPTARFSEAMGGSDAAIGSLQFGAADIAFFGRELDLNDYLGFYEYCGHNPTEITFASGTLDVPGASWAPVIFVNRRNPLAQLTMKQLDGIFGAQRTGGYHGFTWVPQHRTAAENLRTWGQLGLTGAWADQPIQTCGYAPGGMNRFFELAVFDGGDKWAENYREYIENGTKIMAAGSEASGVLHMLKEIEDDTYAIGWAGLPQWNQVPDITGIKMIALAASPDGPYVLPSKATLTDRSYPLTRSVYICLNRPTGTDVPPKVKDFIEFVLSAEGQEIVRQNGAYYPIPAAMVVKERGKLDDLPH